MMYISKGSKFLFLLIYLLFSAVGSIVFAQVNKTDTLKQSTDSVHQMDAADYYMLITKKSLRPHLDSSKIKSLGPFYSPFIYPGYALVTRYLVGLACNVSFYTYRDDSAKISSILIDNVYTQYNQYFTIINSNIWTPHEKLNLIGDWRFYEFPTTTYGLGSKTTLSDGVGVDYSQIKINEVALWKIADNLSAGLGYNFNYHWSISETKNSESDTSDLDRYGFNSKSYSSGISLNIQYDNILNSNNPRNGTFANLQVGNNLRILGSDTNWESLLFDGRQYIPLSKKSGNVLAFWTYDWFTLSGKPPYFDLPTTGSDAYDNTARGYAEGRFKGLNWIYAEVEYRFRILNNGFLGGVLFSNASTLTEWPSNKFERINPGNGFGLRIKMNKHSDTNLCVDYGFGTGTQGFAFNLNEVF